MFVTNNAHQMKDCQKQLLQNQLNKSSESVSQSVTHSLSQSVSENHSLDSSELLGPDSGCVWHFLNTPQWIWDQLVTQLIYSSFFFHIQTQPWTPASQTAHNWFSIWKNSPLLFSRFFLSQLKSLRVNRNECWTEMLFTINLLCFPTINCQDNINNLIW